MENEPWQKMLYGSVDDPVTSDTLTIKLARSICDVAHSHGYNEALDDLRRSLVGSSLVNSEDNRETLEYLVGKLKK